MAAKIIYHKQLPSVARGVPMAGGVQREDDGAFIPDDPRNTDYQDYLASQPINTPSTPNGE